MIDLSQFLDKNVTVTLRDGTTLEGNISFSVYQDTCYKFKLANGLDSYGNYTAKGRFYSFREHDSDIVAIEEVKPAVAENEVSTLSELEVRKARLEAELEEVEQQIQIENGPHSFSALEVFNFLQYGCRDSISLSFNWESTPQGWEHWRAIRYGEKKASREDIENLVNCLLKHFLRKFE
jgi:hypothetical protein